MSVCSLRIAHNERYKNNQTGEWDSRPGYYDVTVWSGMGEWVARNLSKGSKVVVHGRLKWREWTDNNNQKRQAIDITADDVIPIGEREGGNGGGGGGGGASDFSQRSDIPFDAGEFSGGNGGGQQQRQPAGAGVPADDDIPF